MWGSPGILEIDGVGVRIYPLSRKRPFTWVKTKVKWTKTLEKLALSHIGDKYSWVGCFKSAFGFA